MDIESLVHEYGDRIYNLAFKITGDANEAEDIVQETFLRAHRYQDRFRGDSSEYTWLYRIALNVGLRAKERLRNDFFQSLDAATDAWADDVPDDVARWQRDPEARYLYDALLTEIQRACIHFVTRRLTDEQRAVYVLRVMVGLPLDDIVRILEVSKNTVKARLHRAKVALRDYFSGRCQWVSDSPSNSPACTCESKLGFALTAAPEILKKLRDYPVDEQTHAVIRSTVADVTSPQAIQALYPEHSLSRKAIQRILGS
jgi:RNA polymerase sigma-70 factor (ECF subfamily)